MSHRTKCVIKLCVLVLLAALFVFALAGCSPHEIIDIDKGTNSGYNYTQINASEAGAYIDTAIANRKEYYKKDESETEKWFVIDLELDFAYTDYTDGVEQSTKFTLILKANWNIENNDESELFFRIVDTGKLATILGIYYLDNTMYVSLLDGVAGRENMNYRFEEVNFSTIAALLAPLLNNIGAKEGSEGIVLDPLTLIASVGGTNMMSELTPFLKALGVDVSDFAPIIQMFVPGFLFNLSDGKSAYEMSEDGSVQTVSKRVNVNTLFQLVKDFEGMIGGLDLNLPFNDISWSAFGLPDFDPIMQQFLGFSLAKLKENVWPQMTESFFKAISVKKEVNGAEAYVLDGLGLSFHCDPTDKYKNGQYQVDIDISPFYLGTKKEKIDISFSGLELSPDSAKYREGGLLNLEAQLSLDFEAPEGTVLTVGDIVGDTLDELLPANNLKSLKQVPINFNGFNYLDPETGERYTKYRFDLEIKTDLDLFDGNRNNAEVNLYSQDEKILSVYLVGTTIYVYTEGMKGAIFSIPNVSVPEIDLTELLFGETGALAVVMPYLDPHYAAQETPAEGGGASNSGTVDAPSNAGQIDVMALLKELITYKSYYNWKGEKIENETGALTLPGDEDAPLIYEFNRETFNRLMMNFIGYSDLGIESLRLETMLSHPQDSTKLIVELPKKVRLKLQLERLSWLGKPEFDFTNVTDKEYAPVGGDANFYVKLGGEFKLGTQKEDQAAKILLNLADLIQTLTQNIFLDIGLNVSENAETKIRYEIRGNFDMKKKEAAKDLTYVSFRDTSFALYLYAGDAEKHFLMLYYNGTDDMLYIDFSNLTELQNTIPLFKIFKPIQPNLKIKLGLDKLLENKPVLNAGVNADSANADFLMAALSGAGVSFGDPASAAALDPVDLVGRLLEGIFVEDDTLSIVASKQLLTVLFTVLGVDVFGDGTVLPGTNIFGSLNIMNPDPDKGFLELHLGLLGQGGAGAEFLKLDVHLLNKVDVTGNPESFEVVGSGFNADDYENLYHVMETLVVAFELGGRLDLTPLGEGGFSLGEFLASLIGAKYVDPYFDTVQIASSLEFKLKANIDISGLNMPEGGSLVFDPTTLLNSEIQLEIYDKANGGNEKILGVYYKGQDLYLDLHYFLKEKGYIRLTNAGDFIYRLVKGSATKTAERVYETLAGGSIRTGSDAALNEIRMNVLATLTPYGLTVAIAEGALSNLLGGLLGIPSDQMIEFGAVKVEASLEDGIDLRFETSIESAVAISLSLGDLGLSANPDDKVLVLPPAGVNWATSDMATLLTSVLIRVEASIGVGGEGKIDLSPLISSLLSKSNDPTASKIDINVLIDNLGLTAELNAVVEADLNFQAIAESRFRLSLYNGAVSNGDVILTAIYLGNENKLYVKTQLFGICNDPDEFKELDIDKLAGSFMKNALAEANSGESAVAVRNTPLLGLFGVNGDPDPMAQFIRILFVKGGIQLKVAEEALVFLFNSLGVDVSEFFENFTLEAEGELSVSPLFLRLKASVGSPENPNGLTLELNLKNLSVAFGGEIDLADLNAAIGAGKVTTIDSFTSIGVKIAGSLKAEVSSGDQSGEIYFDELVKNILGAVQLPAGIDGATLSTLGLLFKVIASDPASFPKFGGTLYYELSGVINIVTIKNLYLTLKLGTTPGANDVLDVVVRGSAAAGSTGVDIYVNAERLLGIKPFVIKNIVKFAGIFTGTGVNLRGVNPVTNQPYPEPNRAGEVKNLFAALTAAAPGTDAALANAIVLYLASNYEEYGLKAPIVLDVGAGALYGILNSLAGIDLGKYLEGHDVEAELTAGGKEALLSLDLGLQGFVSLGLNLETPTIDLKPTVPEAPLSGYTVLDENFTTLRVILNGKASLKGDFAADADPNSPTNPNTINLANLIGNFLTGVNFDVLVNLLGDVDKTMKYSIDVAVNLKKLIAGDFTGLSGRVEFFDTGDKLLIGAYYLDGNLFLDLTALNLGKIRIDNFAVFLGNIIGTSSSSAPAEAMAALPSDAAARDGALNAAAAAAYINILLGNDTGVVLEVTAEAIALILSSISVGDATLDGEMIKETFHDILALKLGLFHYDPESDSVHILGLSVEIASYTAELTLDGAAIRFDETDVRPDDFQNWQASFGVVGELSEWVYVKAALTFGWHLSDGMSVDFSDILGTFLKSKLDMLSISPVLKILNEFGQNFKLEVEGKIHFGNLMRDGTLLPDLLGSGGFNAEPLMDSQLAIRLISTNGGENREILSLCYVDRALFVDLSAFSIGKVRIPDAYDFFAGMFAPGNTPAALSYALPYSSDPADNVGNSAAYVAKEVGVLGAFINLNISSSAVALHVGTSGLFAILNLVGLDLGGVGLTLEEIYQLVNPLGDLDIAVWLAKQDRLLELALSLKEWTKDNEGNIIAPSDREIALKLGLASDFSVVLGDQKIPQNVVVIRDPESYDRLTDDALIGIATRLDFRIDLKQGSVENIYKDPLQSLIGSLLTQIALSVGVHILDDQTGIVTLSVEAEVPLLTVIAGITAGGFDLKSINARIKVLYAGNGGAEKCYATLVLNNGDLFADLSLLGGPKAMIKDLMGLVSGGFAAPASAGKTEASAPNNAAGGEGETELLPKLPIALELMADGFFVTMRKAAFNTIFGLINVNGKNLGDWEITDDVVFQVGLTGADNPIYGADGKSFKLGASLAFVEGQKEILTLGIDLNGIGAKFSRFGIERPDANEYANIKDVDTIVAETSLELNLAVNDNQEVNLQKTVEALFNALAVVNPLGIPLAPKIQTQTALQETLRLDLRVAINLNAFATKNVQEILAGINVKASLYSLAHPDRFRIDIAFDHSVAYIDATSVGLGKIRLPVNSLLERILGSSTPQAAAIQESLYGYGGAAAAPMNATEAEARKLLALTSLTFGKNGVTAIVAYDTIGTILKMLGVPVGDYIDGVIAPSVEIEVTDKFGFNIVAHILTGTGANGAEDEIAKLGLSLVGQTTNVDVKVSSVQKIESFVPADADAYTDYDKLKLTLDVNASISVDFFKGYIPLDDVLDLLISNVRMGIDVGETHGISFALNGKIGLDLERFLAKNPASLYGELSLDYAIVSAGGVYEQTIAKVYLTEDGVFVELKLQDLGLDLRVKIPDLSLTTLLWNLIDGKDPFASANPNPLYNVSDASTVTAPFTAPLTTLLNAKAEGKEAERALDIVVALTSSELNVEISTMLLASILPILGLEIEDPDAIVESVLTSGKLAISVDPTFRIYLRLQKDPGGTHVDKDGNSHEIGGYVFELSLLQNTGVSLDGADYYDFACRFTDSYTAEGYEMAASPDRFDGLLFSSFAESFLAFNLQKIVSGGAFDVIDDFLSTLGGKVEIGLGVDFKQLVFDLSALFQNEDNAYFYIQIAEALKSAVKITVEFDASLKGVIKDATLGVDAILNFENEYGDVLLNVMVRGGGSGVTSAYTDDVNPAIYVYSEVMGIPKLKINLPILKQFSHLDLNALLESLGLKVGGGSTPNAANAPTAAPRNGILDNSDEGFVFQVGDGTINVGDILGSVSINPGRLSIVLAKTIVQDLLAALLNFPFGKVEDISATLADGLYLNIELQKGFAFKMDLTTLEVDLGGRAVFGKTADEVRKTFAGYASLSQYQWAFEVESELTITDDLISVFSLSKMTTPLIGADVTIEGGEVLGTKLTFLLKGYIDFADLSNLNLQLAVVSGGKQYVNIMYVGRADDPNGSWVYLDLSGLGLPAIKLQLDVGSIVKNLLASLTATEEATGNAAGELFKAASLGAADAMRPANEAAADPSVVLKSGDVQWGLDEGNTLDDVPFGSQLLLLAIGSKDVSVAITGALLSSLIHGLTSAFVMPDLNYIRIGYVEGKMTGLEVVLNEQNFRIAYSFTGNSSSSIGKSVQNPVNPNKNAIGEDLTYSMSDIGVIQSVFFALNMDIRIDTKNANGNKSSQIEGLEAFIETLVKVPDGTVDLAPQRASMILNFNLQLALDLVTLKNTQLALTLSMGDTDLLGVYFDDGALYADLSGLGLFEVKISGLDVISLIMNLLGGTLDLNGGLKVGELINGVLPAAPQNASGGSSGAGVSGYAADALRNAGGVAVLPKIRVVLTNDSVFVMPSMSAIGAIVEKATGKPLGFELPDLAEIRLGINLKEGLNNLSLKLKLDNYNNGVEISIPSDGGLAIRLNDTATKVAMPTNFDQYGGISGLALSNGGISLNTAALVSSLIDSIDAPNSLGIYLKKRNSYFKNTSTNSYKQDSILPGENPIGPATDNGFYESGDFINNRKTSAAIVARRDQATNYLELSVAAHGNRIMVRYDACAIKLYIQELNIDILGSALLSKIVAAIINSFVKDGIFITNLVIPNLIAPPAPIIGSVGSLSGTLTDETGKPLEGVAVTMKKGDRTREAETDALGNYAFTGLETGEYAVSFKKSGYFDVVREAVEVKNAQELEKAQRFDIEMFALSSTTGTYTKIGFYGHVYVKGSNFRTPIPGAEVYIDNRRIDDADQRGYYGVYYEGAVYGARHSIIVKAPGYKTAELTVEIEKSIQDVTTDIELEPLEASKGILKGKFVEKVKVYTDADGKVTYGPLDAAGGTVGYRPVTSGVEIWLKKNGATILNPSALLTPYDFLGWDDQGTRLGMLESDGSFSIANLDYGSYLVKIRSTTFENFDLAEFPITFTASAPTFVFEGTTVANPDGTETDRVFNGQIVLTRRAKTHFSENTVTDTTVSGIRIRLGADKLDGDNNGSGDGDVVSGKFETGAMDNTDSVTYIEAWLGENLAAGLFDTVHNLLSSGLSALTTAVAVGSGFNDTGADARYTPIDLVRTGGVYNEDDLTIYNYRFGSRAEYLRYETAFTAKFASALLRNVLGGLIGGAIGNLPGFLQNIIFGALHSTFGSVGEILGTIFPFTIPYSFAENKDLPGNPLENFKNQGWLTEGTIAAVNGSTPELTRTVEYAEKSVYARIKLNQSNQGGLLESIKLFVNGASYQNRDNMGALGNAFGVNGVNLLGPLQTVRAGAEVADARQAMDGRLRKNTVNDYIVIEDYAIDPLTGEKYLYNQYYIYNDEQDPTNDEFMELDIINTGLYLKSAKTLGEFTNLNGDGSYGPTIELPDRIEFNDPYDPSDFTVFGGTWAAAAGGVRTNTDRKKTPVEISDLLPTRNKIAFRSGGSSGSSGAAVNWSLSVVDFAPKGGSYEIIGSCLNLEIRIPCVVKNREISENEILSILGDGAIPAIDPYHYDETEYKASLPKSFREGTQTVYRGDDPQGKDQTGKYVFDDLKWDLSDVRIDNKGTTEAAPCYLTLTYGYAGSGKGTVRVPVAVLDRTAQAISVSVEGSVGNLGISNSEIVFDPFEINADAARKALSNLEEVRNILGQITYPGAPARLSTPTGAVETPIRSVDLGTFRGVDFDRLTYNQNGEAVYTIYLTVENSVGDRTRLPVTVKVRDKRVARSTLEALTEAERTIRPYRKYGMYDKDVGLNSLPASVTVTHKDGSTKTLKKGVDYVWGLDLGGRVVLEGKQTDGADNWRGLLDAAGGTYRFRIFAPDGSDVFKEAVYGIDLVVAPTRITSAEPVTFDPYGEIRLPSELAVGLNNAAPVSGDRANVRFPGFTEDMISPNFAGSVSYADAEIYDALFETVTLPGVKITVRQANVETLVFPDNADGTPYAVNPYLAAGQIEKLLADPSTYLTVAGAPGVKVSKDLFDVVSFRITDATRSKVRISVKVGNKGYDPEETGAAQWTQEFVMTLRVLDMTDAEVAPIEIGTVYEGLPKEVTVSLPGGEPFAVPVDYLYDRTTGIVDGVESGAAADFYKMSEANVWFVPKNLPGVTQCVTVRIAANAGGANEVASYVLDGDRKGESYYAFQNLPLPETASLTFENGAVKTGLPVVWDTVEGYRNENGTATFTGRIGAAEYGYYPVRYALEIQKDTVGMADLPEVIQLDPLKSFEEQLAVYRTVSANNALGVVVLNAEFPVAEISRNWQGTGEIVYPVRLGRRIALTTGEVFVYEEIPVKIQTLRREAVKVSEQLIGNVYNEIDFGAIKRVTVEFESGQIMTSEVRLSDWSGLDTIDYRKANVYIVRVTVFGDDPDLRQTVEVRVDVKSAVLIEAYRTYENGRLSGKVNGLIGEVDAAGNPVYTVVDPFAGFDPKLMPAELWGRFDGFDEPIKLKADWSVDHIVDAMSVAGGDFTVAGHNAGAVTLYLEKDGQRVRPQQLAFEVRVLKRTVESIGYSKDPNASTQTEYETLSFDDYNAAKPAGDRRLYYKMFLNPYGLASYNEDPTAKDFAYYKAIKVSLSGGDPLYFNVENMEYEIYDADTLRPTVLSELYRGRNVIVRMVANRANIRDKEGRQILASDALVLSEIRVRIHDMTYTAGGTIPSDFTVDLYKEYFDYGAASNVLSISELRKNIKDITTHVTISGTDSVTRTDPATGEVTTELVTADFDKITVGTGRLNVNYLGETGYLDYTFGNQVGGIQTVSVPVRYVRRVLGEAFDPDRTEHYYTKKADGLYTMGASDPTMVINPAYTKDFAEGFLYDPFANYTLESFFLTASETTRFITDGGVSEEVKTAVPLAWKRGKVYIDKNGGDFTVSAVVSVPGDASIEQSLKYRFRVLKRKAIYATSADDPKGDNLKSLLRDKTNSVIRAYDYIGYDDVDAEVGRKLFVDAGVAFRVAFEEGCPIDYSFGARAGTVSVNGGALVPEGAFNMTFHIDSLKPLNSKGNDVRFEMTIPGYGLGAVGQQSLYLYVKSEKQEIVSVKTFLTSSHTEDQAVPLIDYFTKEIAMEEGFTSATTGLPAIESIGADNNATKVNNQYFFINRGGLALPDTLNVTVKNETGATKTYVVQNVNWTGASANRFTVRHTGGSYFPSFSMPVDNQNYSFMIQAEPMLFRGRGGVMVDTTGTPYGKDEVILLPMRENLTGDADTVVTDNGTPVVDSANYIAGENYGYAVTFGNGEKVSFAGVNGGGNYRNRYNLWDFTSIDFGNTAEVQYATMTLGGKGGETVKWALRIADKTEIGTSMQTVQLAGAGGSASANVTFDFTYGDMGTLGGNAQGRLPNRFYQYFDGQRKSSAIPVTYGGLLSDSLGSYLDENGNNQTNFTYDANSRTVSVVSKNSATEAPIATPQSDGSGSVTLKKPVSKAAAIRWTATTYRAYPAPSEAVGGVLYFGMYPYMATASNKNVSAYFRNPENPMYSFNGLAPDAAGGGWTYPVGLVSDSTSGGEQDLYLIPPFADGAAAAQPTVPVYQVVKGSVFDVKYLPLFTIENSVYYVPWHLADVYEIGKPEWRYDAGFVTVPSPSSAEPGRDGASGTTFSHGALYNETLAGGIRAIDTTKTGTRYTLVLKIPGASSANGNFQLIVAIDVVEPNA